MRPGQRVETDVIRSKLRARGRDDPPIIVAQRRDVQLYVAYEPHICSSITPVFQRSLKTRSFYLVKLCLFLCIVPRHYGYIIFNDIDKG